MANIKELRQRRTDLTNEGKRVLESAAASGSKMNPTQESRYEAILGELEGLGPQITLEEHQMDLQRAVGLRQSPCEVARGSGYGGGAGFANFGEQLQAVSRFSRSQGRDVDVRLLAAATGSSEGVPADGGFFVQQDFIEGLFKRTYDAGQILSRVRHIEVGPNSNGAKFLGVDESSRVAGSRWGGVQIYRLEEAGTKTKSKPTFRKMELTLKKIAALWYCSDELLQDANVLAAVGSDIFASEMTFAIENEIINGTGAGQMVGVLNSPCLVTVPKETGQTAKTFVFENIVKMWARLGPGSATNAVWLINQDVLPALYGMGLVIGTGGTPAFLPAGGLSGSPYNTLFGRPVIPVEYCSTLGTLGDIILADFSQYVMIEKGGLQTAVSIHVQFIQDETVFRFVMRNDGQPLWNAPLTPFKGTNTLSPFVTLAARA